MFYSKKLNKFKNLKHCFFSRKNGFSKGPYESLNCGMGSNDKKKNINKNLKKVSYEIGCKEKSLITLNQTHSNTVIYFKNLQSIKNKLSGDAIVTKIKNIGISILTADCAPIFIYDPVQKIIGCVHSGWKGVFNGVLKNTIKKFNELNSNNEDLIAVVGPCIQKQSYEVKEDFYKKFTELDTKNKFFFKKNNNGNYFFDLRGIINKQISDLSINNIDNIEMDTFLEKETFFSYRRSCLNKEKDYGRCISVILMT